VQGTRGYILLESIVSMALLSICMLGIYGGMRDAAGMRALAEDFTTARFLLEDVATQHELQPEVMEGEGRGQFPAPHDRFSHSWAITRVPVPMEALPQTMSDEQRQQFERQFKRFMGRLRVTIRWTRAGLEHEVTGETLLAPNQLWTPPELP
jgi:type II secretory pathway pseudopilin PulG